MQTSPLRTTTLEKVVNRRPDPIFRPHFFGDDNNDFIYIGANRTFGATRDGALFIGINEGYLDDNKGTYAVKVEILPDDK
ncbi:MAG: hypothetical protein JO314_08600 [Acidobacteria bacterium]|nr:hypothetical protein [Acidobacteriota bacterium]